MPGKNTTANGTVYGNTVNFTTASSPVLSVSRTHMNFTVMLSGTEVDTMTGSQRFFIVNTGGGSLEWSAAASDNWIDVSPSAGTGDALVSVSLNPTGLTIGENTGSLVISATEALDSPQTITINLRVADNSEDTPPRGSFDTPLEGSQVSGSIPVTGWAIDDVDVTAVKIYRDPVPGEGPGLVYIMDASFVEGARPDVEALYTGFPNNSTAGWGYLMPTIFLPNGGNGIYTLHVEAVDTRGHKTLLGNKTIICDNANAVKPFGTIDTPAPDEITSGTAFINWGWVLTPQPNYIPYDGSTISVLIDGKDQGSPQYNVYRQDIARLLPGYINSNGAGGYYSIDTSAFTTGMHTISWNVTDSAGNTDGIGSRYFIIINPGASGSSTASSHQVRRSKSQALSLKDAPAPHSHRISTYLSVHSGWQRGQRICKRITKSGEKGIFYINIKELEPLEVAPEPGIVYTAANMLAAGKLRPLPPGASLNPRTGTFHWMPGPGFNGAYTVVLTGRKLDGEIFTDYMLINIKPKFNVIPR